MRQFFSWKYSKRHWKLLEDWSYPLPDKTTIVIPKGFEFDGASIPRAFWFLLNPVGLLFVPSLIHDFAYQYGMLWTLQDNDDGLERFIEYQKGAPQRFWDKLFREISGQDNGFFFVNYAAWSCLRLGGWWAWSRYRQMEAPPPVPSLPATNHSISKSG